MTQHSPPPPSEKLTVEGALDMARRCRYLDNGPVCYDKTLYGAVWALADEVERLRGIANAVQAVLAEEMPIPQHEAADQLEWARKHLAMAFGGTTP